MFFPTHDPKPSIYVQSYQLIGNYFLSNHGKVGPHSPSSPSECPVFFSDSLVCCLFEPASVPFDVEPPFPTLAAVPISHLC